MMPREMERGSNARNHSMKFDLVSVLSLYSSHWNIQSVKVISNVITSFIKYCSIHLWRPIQPNSWFIEIYLKSCSLYTLGKVSSINDTFKLISKVIKFKLTHWKGQDRTNGRNAQRKIIVIIRLGDDKSYRFVFNKIKKPQLIALKKLKHCWMKTR